MSRNGRERRHGQIHAHDRDTHNIGLLGDEMMIQEADRVAIQETEKQKINPKLLKEHFDCIGHFIRFLREECPAHCDVGVVELTEDQKTNPDLFHHNNTFDLKCAGLNVKFLKAFMGKIKKKGNGKTCSFSNWREHEDAIVRGAKQAKGPVFGVLWKGS